MSGITSVIDNNILNSPPITSGLVGSENPNIGSGFIYMSGLDSATNSTTTWADAVNYTGAGVVEFAAEQMNGASGTAQIRITIDGLIVADQTTSAADKRVVAPVGVAYQSAANYTAICLSAVPFTSSLRIEHRLATGSGSAICIYKYRKTQ